MKGSGNGNPAICANNLVRISRGEIPFDRIKGVRLAELTGSSLSEREDLIEDTKWRVETYEPRVSVESVKLETTDAANGQVALTVNITGRTD